MDTQSGISNVSKIALNTSTPGALANDTGVLKRAVLQPDEFPRVSLEVTNPPNPFTSMDPANRDRANKGKTGSDRGKRVNYPMNDGKSKTA